MNHLMSGCRIIDLTHSYSSETIYWPTEDGFKFEKEFDGMTDKGYYYAANKFCTAEHGGTHMDAPIHFSKNGMTVDQIPLDNLVGPGVVVDVSEKTKNNPDYQVGIGDFEDWEKTNNHMPDGSIILLCTGHARFWPDPIKYTGTDKKGLDAITDLHFPGLHPHAASWLVKHKKIAAVGLDTPSIDYGQSKMFETHRILCQNNIVAFENVSNLDLLPKTGTTIIALPMKIKGGSGAPLRLVAIIPDQQHS